MKPAYAAGLAAVGLVVAGGVAALALRPRRRPDRAGGASSAPGTASPADDPIVAPAYAYLDLWSPDARRALHDLQKEIGLDPRKGGLAGVIFSESGGDPAAPHKREGTPRGGLVQVTEGALVPGYGTAESVWGIRNQDSVTQLRGVVRDFFRRQFPHGPPGDQSAASLRRRNYLPAIADKPASFVLGVRPDGKRDSAGKLLPGEKPAGAGPAGEKPEDALGPGLALTRGRNYGSNRGFDPSGRGFFTWEDVDRGAAAAERAALARGWVRVSGARVPPGDLPVAGAVGDSEAEALSRAIGPENIAGANEATIDAVVRMDTESPLAGAAGSNESEAALWT